ncbi:MAG: hypothetical protein ACK4K9_09780 [Bacteroidia bacterium]
MSDKIKEVNKIDQNPQFQTQSNNNYLLLDSLSKLSINIMQSISELEQNDFCTLLEIINSEDSPEQKLNNIYNNPVFGNVHNSLLSFGEYIQVNNIQRFLGDDDAKQYLTHRILTDLEIDIYAPNNDPCAIYKASLSKCAIDYAICLLGAIGTGATPLGYCILLFCQLSVAQCLDLAAKSSPNCVSASSRYQLIINPILYNINNC